MADCAENFGIIEETLGEALELHQSGKLAEAEERYREILAVCEEQAEVRYYLGLVCHATTRTDEAVRHLAAARRLEPQQAIFHLAAGNVWQQQGKYAAAVDAYQEAIAHEPDNGRAHYNLGVAAYASGQLDTAIAAYERAVTLLPDDADAFYNLAIAYDKAGQPAAALRAYGQALSVAPTDPDIRYNLALLYKKNHEFEDAQRHLEEVVRLDAGYARAYSHLAAIYGRQGRREAAIACFERLLELGHDQEAAHHMLAALRGERRDTAAAGYVRKLFDGYADSFEVELVERLGYRSPSLLRQMVERLPLAGTRPGRVLDLGCGTGLAGEAFRDLAATLVGVDLSPRMLAIAERKGIYDTLAVGEVVDFCRRQTERYDCIVAADVLVYLGNIAPLFAAVAHCLAPGGLFAFSTERYEQHGFVLRPSGRYAHSPSYIGEMAAAHGLAVRLREETALRREKEEWLTGNLFVLTAAG